MKWPELRFIELLQDEVVLVLMFMRKTLQQS
jgi:hypothetical protein